MNLTKQELNILQSGLFALNRKQIREEKLYDVVEKLMLKLSKEINRDG